MKALLFTIAMVLSCNVFAQQAYVCTQGEAESTIEVVYTTPGKQVPCKVLYTKPTSVRALWAAKAQIGYCESKAEAFINKLQNNGWACTTQSEDKEKQVQEIKSEVQEVNVKALDNSEQEIKTDVQASTEKVIYSKDLFILK